ncbi:MAG: zinc-binding alcohol dehydrogenase [Chthoniobacteraceae bacterium]
MSGKGIVFQEPGKVEIQSYDIPSLEPDEILVKTEYSGVSQGTEIWAYQGMRPEIKFPTVPGYQTIGRVLETGSKVANFTPGQRVMVTASRLPSSFPETWMGAHSSHVVAKEATPVPEGCDPVGAAVSALAAVSLRGICMLDIGFGDVVVVTGQGLIGQSSAQLAGLRGGIVIATDIMPSRLALSKKNGTAIVVNVKEQNLGDVVRELRPKGVDAVIETTGRSDQFAPCVDLLRWEGQLLLQGWYAKPVTFDFHATHLKKPRVAITCGFDLKDASTCMELSLYGKLKLRELVSHLVPFEQAPEIYPRLAAGDPEFLGVVFDWTRL